MLPITITSLLRASGAKPWTLSLDNQRVLLAGDNGAGKSAVIDSLDLALTGEVHKFAGRDSVRDAAMIHAAGPGSTIEVTVQAGGTTYGAKVARNGVSRTVNGEKVDRDARPAGALFVRSVREAFATMDGALRMASSHGGMSVAEAVAPYRVKLATMENLTADQRTLALAVLDAHLSTPNLTATSFIDAVQGALQTAREALTAAEAAEAMTRQGAEQDAADAGIPVIAAPTPQEIENARTMLEYARGHAQASTAQANLIERLTAIRAEAEYLIPTTRAPRVPAGQREMIAVLDAGTALAARVAGLGTPRCPCCAGSFDVSQAAAQAQWWFGQRAMQAQGVEASDAADVAQKRVDALRVEYGALDAQVQEQHRANMANPAYVPWLREQTSRQVLEAQRRLDAMLARTVGSRGPAIAAQNVADAKGRVAVAEAVRDVALAWNREANEVKLKAVLEAARVYLPDGWSLAVESVGKAAMLRLNHDGRANDVPSEGQAAVCWVAITVAMAGATRAPAVVLGEDVALSPRTLTTMLEALARPLPENVVLVLSTTSPYPAFPSAWHLVSLPIEGMSAKVGTPDPQDPPKRKRRTKAEMETARAAEAAAKAGGSSGAAEDDAEAREAANREEHFAAGAPTPDGNTHVAPDLAALGWDARQADRMTGATAAYIVEHKVTAAQGSILPDGTLYLIPAPTEPTPLDPLQTQIAVAQANTAIIRGLGFSDAQIERMAPATAMYLVENRIRVDAGVLLSDGTWCALDAVPTPVPTPTPAPAPPSEAPVVPNVIGRVAGSLQDAFTQAAQAFTQTAQGGGGPAPTQPNTNDVEARQIALRAALPRNTPTTQSGRQLVVRLFWDAEEPMVPVEAANDARVAMNAVATLDNIVAFNADLLVLPGDGTLRVTPLGWTALQSLKG